MLGAIISVEFKSNRPFSYEQILDFLRVVQSKGIDVSFTIFPRKILKMIKIAEEKCDNLHHTRIIFSYFMYDIIFKVAKIYTNNWSEGGGKITLSKKTE